MKKQKVYVVALTERYENRVLATSREEAIAAVDEHAGGWPIWSRITATVAADQSTEDVEIVAATGKE